MHVPEQTLHSHQKETNSDLSRPEPDPVLDESSKDSSAGSPHSFLSHERIYTDSNDASSRSSGEQARHAVNDRLDVLRNMVGRFSRLIVPS